jgi:hypothetical protein
MRVFSPSGAGLLLRLVMSLGCGMLEYSPDKDNTSSVDPVEAAKGEDVGVRGHESQRFGVGASPRSIPDAAPAHTAQGVNEAGLYVSSADTGGSEQPSSYAHSVVEQTDAGQAGSEAGAVPYPTAVGENGSDVVGTYDSDAGNGANATSGELGDSVASEAGAKCVQTAGDCDPTVECAQETCQFETSGKSCAFTPTRPAAFHCLVAGIAPDYSPCDRDDACQSGSVCVADTFIGRDPNGNALPRRSGTLCRPTCRSDDDCADGDWCQQATDDNNEPYPSLRVCHRHCRDPRECYGEPVSADVRCTPQDTLVGLENTECSRRPDNLNPPASADQATAGQPRAAVTLSRGGIPYVVDAVQSLDTEATWLLQTSAAAAYCLNNWDCDDSLALCLDNACRNECEQATECAAGSQCVAIEGVSVCGDPCIFDAQAGDSCSIDPNCGCPDEQTCRLNDDQTTSCSSVGDHGYMQWCATQTQCEQGLSCINGLCRPICVPGESECAAGQGACVLAIKSEERETFTCSGDCDPVHPNDGGDGRTPCGVGAVCLPTWDPKHYPHALCASEAPLHTPRTLGQSCEEDVDCASGLGCDANGTCRPWCRADEDCDSADGCDTVESIYGVVARFGRNTNDRVGLCR